MRLHWGGQGAVSNNCPTPVVCSWVLETETDLTTVVSQRTRCQWKSVCRPPIIHLHHALTGVGSLMAHTQCL